MATHEQRLAWAVALTGAGLFAWQSALAGSDGLTLRYGVTVLATAGAAWWAGRASSAPRRAAWPEPMTLALAALVALSLWAVAWWAMDGTNYVLERWVGPLAWPRSVTILGDRILGVRLAPLTYELSVIFAVILLPMAQGWLLWGRLLPALTARLGARRAIPLTAVLGGALLTLSAVQGVAPALPWGVAALPGYALLALAAALATCLSGSPWTGTVVHGSFAYASLAWQDDLFRAFAGVNHLDLRWLTVVVLGTLGAVLLLQIIRFRSESRAGAASAGGRFPWADWWPLALLAVAVLILTMRDVRIRHDQAQRQTTPAVSQTAQQ